jgi:hypothetical protein
MAWAHYFLKKHKCYRCRQWCDWAGRTADDHRYVLCLPHVNAKSKQILTGGIIFIALPYTLYLCFMPLFAPVLYLTIKEAKDLICCIPCGVHGCPGAWDTRQSLLSTVLWPSCTRAQRQTNGVLLLPPRKASAFQTACCSGYGNGWKPLAGGKNQDRNEFVP